MSSRAPVADREPAGRLRICILMQHRSRAAPNVRSAALGITLVGHVVVLLLVVADRRTPRRDQPEAQAVEIWLQPLQELPNRPAVAAATPPATGSQPASPARVITLPAAPQATQAAASPSLLQGPIDWNAAATSAAARSVAANSQPATFSPPPKPIPEPCKPRVFDKETERLMADRLPQPEDPLGVGPDPQANCVVVGGRPAAKFRPARRPTDRLAPVPRAVAAPRG